MTGVLTTYLELYYILLLKIIRFLMYLLCKSGEVSF